MSTIKKISFKNRVKQELCALPFDSEGCMRAELAGILTPNSKLIIDENNQIETLVFYSDHADVIEKIKKLSQTLFDVCPVVTEIAPAGIIKTVSYKVQFQKNLERQLKDLRMIKRGNDGQLMTPAGIPPFFRTRQRFLKAYLRGVFLACGTIADPEKGYRLEFTGNKEDFMDDVKSVLALYGMNFSLLGRHKHFVIYSKEAESVSLFLNLTGAHKALLGMENIRAFREVRNDVNRKVNCDLANVKKTTQASEKQMNLIHEIELNEGLNTLPEQLRQLALLRKNNPEMTIRELGEKTEPPIGKSAVAKRFEKMERLHRMYLAEGKNNAKNNG